MRVKSDSYELTKLAGNYEKVAEALRYEAMMHSVVGDREQFYMPGGKVTLQLRKCEDKTFLDVTRTSWREPGYVKKILEQLGGEWSGSHVGKVQPDKSIDLLLKF